MRKLASWDAQTKPKDNPPHLVVLIELYICCKSYCLFSRSSSSSFWKPIIHSRRWRLLADSGLQSPAYWYSWAEEAPGRTDEIPKWCWFKEVEIKSWILLKFHSSLRLWGSSFLSLANIFLFKWAPGLELKILMKKEWLRVSLFEVRKLKSFCPERKQWTWNVISSSPWR